MTPSTDIDTRASSVPALASTPSVKDNIDSDDVVIPRLKIAQPQSPAVIDELCKQGSIFYADGEDAVEVVHDPSVKGSEPLKFHVLGMYKRWSLSQDGEDLQTWAFSDPNRHPDAWKTFNYSLYLPDVEDNFMPYKLLLTKTATNSAKQINMAIAKHSGPAHDIAFTMSTKRREKQDGASKYVWFVPVISTVETKADDVEAAASLASLVAHQPEPASAPPASDAPEI